MNGEMAERSNAAVLKTVVPARVPGVRIPLSPLKIETRLPRVFLFTPLNTSKVDCSTACCVNVYFRL